MAGVRLARRVAQYRPALAATAGAGIPPHIDRRELDSVVICDGAPLFAVECKSGDRFPSPAIACFRQRPPIEDFHQVHLDRRDYVSNCTRVLPFRTLCREPALP